METHSFHVSMRARIGINVDAILVVGGAAVWGVCAIYAQVCGVVMLPEVSEIGKACIFVGIGRATKGDNAEEIHSQKETEAGAPQ